MFLKIEHMKNRHITYLNFSEIKILKIDSDDEAFKFSFYFKIEPTEMYGFIMKIENLQNFLNQIEKFNDKYEKMIGNSFQEYAENLPTTEEMLNQYK